MRHAYTAMGTKVSSKAVESSTVAAFRTQYKQTGHFHLQWDLKS